MVLSAVQEAAQGVDVIVHLAAKPMWTPASEIRKLLTR